eukprot:scaffold195872_cov31-Tisochrysis_lutea.AAC.1
MNNERIGPGSPLYFEDARQSGRVPRIRPQTVHSLRREGHEFSGGEKRGCLSDILQILTPDLRERVALSSAERSGCWRHGAAAVQRTDAEPVRWQPPHDAGQEDCGGSGGGEGTHHKECHKCSGCPRRGCRPGCASRTGGSGRERGGGERRAESGT